MVPSGNLTKLWTVTMINGKIHYTRSFSIAMLNYQSVDKKMQNMVNKFSIEISDVVTHVTCGPCTVSYPSKMIYFQSPGDHRLQVLFFSDDFRSKLRLQAGYIHISETTYVLFNYSISPAARNMIYLLFYPFGADYLKCHRPAAFWPTVSWSLLKP